MPHPPVGRGALGAAAPFLLLLLLGAPARAAEEAEDEEITVEPTFGAGGVPDKVGLEVHLTKAERGILRRLECPLCRAITSEMHSEVAKHNMTRQGWGSEEQVWETSNAMCLALVQKYRLNLTTRALDRIAEGDEEAVLANAGNSGDFVRGLLVLKMGCQGWIEDYGSEMSGFVYKSVKGNLHEPQAAGDEFCARKLNLCGAENKKKRRSEQEKEKQRRKAREELLKKEEEQLAKATKEDPLSNLPPGSKEGMQRMLQMAKDDPLMHLDEKTRDRVHRARKELRCPVCRVVLEEVQAALSKRRKGSVREYDVLPVVEGVCEGDKDTSVPVLFGIEPPRLPPLWTDSVRPGIDPSTKKYFLRPFTKKQAKQRQAWRRSLVDGSKAEPPPAAEYERDLILGTTCKDVLEPERMAEAMFKHFAACGSPAPCQAALLAAREVCKDVGGAPCSFEEKAAGGRGEL